MSLLDQTLGDLSETVNFQTALNECLAFMMRTYRLFLKMPSSSTTFDALFDCPLFLSTLPLYQRQFFQAFCQSQIFQYFIQTRTSLFLKEEPFDCFDIKVQQFMNDDFATIQDLRNTVYSAQVSLLCKRRRGGMRWRTKYLQISGQELRASTSLKKLAAKKPKAVLSPLSVVSDPGPSPSSAKSKRTGYSIRITNPGESIVLLFETNHQHYRWLRTLQLRTLPPDFPGFFPHQFSLGSSRKRSLTSHQNEAIAYASSLMAESVRMASVIGFSSEELSRSFEEEEEQEQQERQNQKDNTQRQKQQQQGIQDEQGQQDPQPPLLSTFVRANSQDLSIISRTNSRESFGLEKLSKEEALRWFNHPNSSSTNSSSTSTSSSSSSTSTPT